MFSTVFRNTLNYRECLVFKKYLLSFFNLTTMLFCLIEVLIESPSLLIFFHCVPIVVLNDNIFANESQASHPNCQGKYFSKQ